MIETPNYQGLCLACDYPLRGLAENRCPECGRGFDPKDPKSVNPGKSLGWVGRRLLRPPGWPMFLLIGLTALVSLWLFRMPGTYDGARERTAFAAALWTPVAALWLLRGVVAAITRWARKQPMAGFAHAWKRWGALPAAAAVTCLVVAANLPFRAALSISRPALDRFADETLAGPELLKPADRWVGVFPIRHIYRLPGEVGFEFERDPVVKLAFDVVLWIHPAYLWTMWASSLDSDMPEFGLVRAAEGSSPMAEFHEPGIEAGKYEEPFAVAGYDDATGRLANHTKYEPLGGGWHLSRFVDKNRAWVFARRDLARRAGPAHPSAATLLPELVSELGQYPSHWDYHHQLRSSFKSLSEWSEPEPRLVKDAIARWGWSAFPALLDAAEQFDDEYVRVHAINYIAETHKLNRTALTHKLIPDAPVNPHHERTAMVLAGLLTDSNGMVSGAAMRALQVLEPAPPAIADRVAAALTSSKPSMRRGAAELLGSMGDAGRKHIDALLKLFAHSDDDTLIGLLTALEKLKPDPAKVIPGTIAHLNNRQWSYGMTVGMRAARVLASYGPAARAALPAILTAHGKCEANSPERIDLAMAAAGVAPDDPKAREILASIFPTDDSRNDLSYHNEAGVRAAFVMLRVDPAHRPAVRLLCRALRVHWSIPGIREEIVRTLGRVGAHHPDLAVTALTDSLHYRNHEPDPFPVQLVHAVEAIGPKAGEKAIKTMEGLYKFHQVDPEYRKAVEKAAARIRAKD